MGGFAGGLDDELLEMTGVKIRQQGVLRDTAPQSEGGTGQLARFGQAGVALRRAGDAFKAVDASRGERRKQPADGAAGAGKQRFGLWPGVQQVGGAPVAGGQIALEEGW